MLLSTAIGIHKWIFARLLLIYLVLGGVACEAGGDANQVYLAKAGSVHDAEPNTQGYYYRGIWEAETDSYKVLHVVFLPHRATCRSVGSSTPGDAPSARGISSYPDGLYFDGVAIRRGPQRRVFVATQDRRMRPVSLTETELQTVLPEAIERVGETEVWKQKIKPVLDEERWTLQQKPPQQHTQPGGDDL